MFFKLGPVWNATLNPNFCISFLIFGPIFGYPRKGNCLFFLSVVVIIVGTTCFLFKFINYLLLCFPIMSIFAKYINQIFYFLHQIFSEQIFVALARNPLNMLVIVSGGMQECGLICTFVRAGLRWTSNSYLPLLFFIFISRKFKHSSSFSSIVNWISLPCYLNLLKFSRLFLRFESRTSIINISPIRFGARSKVNASAMALCSKFWM